MIALLLATSLLSAPSSERAAGEAVLGFRVLDVDGELHRIGSGNDFGPAALVFLDPECPISNRYVPELGELHGIAASVDVEFYGVLSDPSLTLTEARAFRDEYEIDWPILFDATGEISARLQPTTVPSAFLVDATDRLIYSGRIDDRFVAPGRMRRQVTSHDLREALRRARGNAPEPEHTTAVGCVFEAWKDEPDSITYAQHIAPLIAANCVECHRTGGIAPFALDTYERASRRARMSAFVTEEHIMPPWRGNPAVGRFRDERILSEREIDLLRRWSDAGAPRGEGAAPAPPEFRDGWALGEPDAVATMEEPFPVPAEGDDIYRRFVMPIPFDRDQVVVGVDFRPGDPEVVHHANIFVDYGGEARAKDALDELPGFDAFGSQGGMQGSTEWETEGMGIGGWAPGADGYRLPEGLGMYVPAGGDLVVEVHYHLSGRATEDRSSVAFHFADEPVENYVDGLLIGSQDLDIPPGEKDYRRHIRMDVPVDMVLVDLFPHMHYIGTEVRLDLTLPDGTVRPLAHVTDWDLRWQNFYRPLQPLSIPAGSRIDAWFHYDNSPGNPDNPHVPPRRVKWGWESDQEMLEVWITVVHTNARDMKKLHEASWMTWYRSASPPSEAAARD